MIHSEALGHVGGFEQEVAEDFVVFGFCLGDSRDKLFGDDQDVGSERAEGAAWRTRPGGDRMNCEDLRPEYGAYSLGAAVEPELSEITEHLERGCPECVAGVRSAMGTVAMA